MLPERLSLPSFHTYHSFAMKLELKIVIGYALLLLLLAAAFVVFPHRELEWMGITNVSLQLLLAFLSILVAVNTDDASQRLIFVCSALYFGSGLFLLLSSFAGRAFMVDDVYGPFFYHFYMNKVGLSLVASLAVLSVAVDFLFRRISVTGKSFLTVALAGMLVFTFFSPHLFHPFGLHKEPDYVLLSAMATEESALKAELGKPPSDAELANRIAGSASVGKAGEASSAHAGTTLASVVRLRGYIEGGGLTTVFWLPMDRAKIYVHAVLLAVIALLLVFFYKMDRYLGAYVDKILILFFLFNAMEIVHAVGFILTPNAADYRMIFRMGQYFTICCLLLLVYAYDLKLRFVLSVAGKYYESKVSRSPESVTRWRDELDQLILRTFVKRNHGQGRMAIFSKSTKIDKGSR